MEKVALITGGSRGIGLGIATQLAKEGWSLAINGVRQEQSVDTLDHLRRLGTKIIYCQGSVGDSAVQQRIIQEVIDAFGHLNVLINNAGIAPKVRMDLLDTTKESYDEVMNTNLKSAFFLSQLAAKEMIKMKKNHLDFFAAVVNISSISATVVSINRGEYCVSKAGLSMVTQLFATRLGAEGIPVYEVRPGVTYTDMTAGVKEKYDRLIEEGLCVSPRWGYPEDVGKAVAALVRNDFPYSTGQVIMVDGGLTIPRL